MTAFERSLAEVLKDEGGYSNHPKDPGGATNFGVIQRVYDDFRKRNGFPARSVKSITQDEVKTIYRASYWTLAKCDSLPAGVDYVVFDGAVNSGVKQSIKWLQRALGVRDDGIIGPTTLNAANSYPDHDELVDKICDARLRFLKALKTWSTFGKGWQRRVERVRKLGKIMAKGGYAPTPNPSAGGEAPTAKAYVEDAEKPISPAAGDAATGAGTTGVILTQTIDQLTPLSNVDAIAKIVAVLTVVSALVAVGGIAYGTYARHRKAAVKDAVQAGV